MAERAYRDDDLSHLTAWTSRDLVLAGQQRLTRDWWEARGGYELFVSILVLRECGRGDPDAASARLEVLRGIPVLAQTSAADTLAEDLVRLVPLPARAESDARHIAVGAVHGIQYLLTWNCTHIANAAPQARVQSVCRLSGFEPPTICTPPELPRTGE